MAKELSEKDFREVTVDLGDVMMPWVIWSQATGVVWNVAPPLAT